MRPNNRQHHPATGTAAAASRTAPSFHQDVRIHGAIETPEQAAMLSLDVLRLISHLHYTLEPRRRALLLERTRRALEIDGGVLPHFLEETRAIREDTNWRCAPIPPSIQDRRVEITGPVDRCVPACLSAAVRKGKEAQQGASGLRSNRLCSNLPWSSNHPPPLNPPRKMVINGLNSGARVYMADFEDSTSPTWVGGSINWCGPYDCSLSMPTKTTPWQWCKTPPLGNGANRRT